MTSADHWAPRIARTPLMAVTASESRSSWYERYRLRLIATDVLVVVGAVGLAHVVRLGSDQSLVGTAGTAWSFVDYSVVSVALAVVWLAFLAIFRTRSKHVIGGGAEEYRRVLSASLRLFGLVAIVALLFHIDFARGYLAIALPVGLLGLLVSRHRWRSVLNRDRATYGTSVLVIGSRAAASELAGAFERDSRSGYTVVGACVPGAVPGIVDDGFGDLTVGDRSIPVLGDESAVVSAMSATGADVVAVTATEHLGPVGMKRLAWDLEPYDVDLVVAPGMVDIAGPRLALRPIADLPLLHVEKPAYHGATKFSKTMFDVCFAAVALVLVSPVMLLIAAAIKLDSRGTVFYRSERMGRGGQPFSMIKFRTMVPDADRVVADLLSRNESEGGVLFKMRHDPRITRVGRILRKFSLDELPQFVNVLRGQMSVVGPRPPLRREVETYDGDVRRRLLVRPGVTGLWQVSGRSDLSWEQSVRLDLSYVENWSMTQDLLIIVKTVRAVLGSRGAY